MIKTDRKEIINFFKRRRKICVCHFSARVNHEAGVVREVECVVSWVALEACTAGQSAPVMDTCTAEHSAPVMVTCTAGHSASIIIPKDALSAILWSHDYSS